MTVFTMNIVRCYIAHAFQKKSPPWKTHSFWTIHAESEWVVCNQFLTQLPDPEGAPFAEVAQTAGLQLVTGNLKHYSASACPEIDILTPSDFLEQRRSI
jgi:hypothetical protein